MMMTVDEKLHAYAKNQKDRNIDEKKLQQTIIKSKEHIGMEKSKEICHG